jgi:hypothetical protein
MSWGKIGIKKYEGQKWGIKRYGAKLGYDNAQCSF